MHKKWQRKRSVLLLIHSYLNVEKKAVRQTMQVCSKACPVVKGIDKFRNLWQIIQILKDKKVLYWCWKPKKN